MSSKKETNNVNRKVQNCLSFDIEGFVESNVQSFSISQKYISESEERYEIEKNVSVILKLLDELRIKATFFFLGRISRDIPQIVKETAGLGHEIACHSHEHKRIYGMKKSEFREDLKRAKGSLENISGQMVYGFRAPDFSITKKNLWAIDLLKELGFDYDSSICPTDMHDVYGIGDADPFIHKLPNDLIEFPVSVIEIFSRRIPFGGGGYFRLYPLILTKYLTSKINGTGHPLMLYMHPYEVGPEIPIIKELSGYRKFRHYYNCNNGSQRLKSILQSFKFGTAIEILTDKGLIKNNA